MKRFALLFFSFFILIAPVNAEVASDVNYDLTDYQINAKINADGSMNVTEDITLDGSMNGYFRDILYRNSKAPKFDGLNSDFSGNTLYDATIVDNVVVSVNGSQITQTKTATKGEDGIYTVTPVTNGGQIKVFSPTKNGTKIVRFEYRVVDAVVIHNDVAELFWTFIGTDFQDKISNLKVNVTLPDSTKTFRVWAHGPLSGNINKKGNDQVQADIKQLSPGGKIDLRIVFDKSIVPGGTKLSNIAAEDKIVENETAYAKIANNERMKARIIIYGLITLSIIDMIALIILSIIYYKKYGVKHSAFTMEYHRDIVNDYGPENMYYLIKADVNSSCVSASLLELIRRKVFTIEEIPEKKKSDYKLTLNKKHGPVSENEQFIIDWLVNDVGDGSSFSIKDIETSNKDTINALKFVKTMEAYKKQVTELANERYNFFLKKVPEVIYLVIALVLALILMVLSVYLSVSPMFIVPLFVVALIAFLMTVITKVRTKEGNLEYLKWMAFKQFLLDFGRMDEKEVPEIVLWEKYLVYATALGIADKVSSAMKIRVENLPDNDQQFFQSMIFYHIMFNGNFNSSFSNSFTSSFESSFATATSTMSSGTGAGGGFSGGGGSGGGGGGGGGGF